MCYVGVGVILSVYCELRAGWGAGDWVGSVLPVGTKMSTVTDALSWNQR